MIKETFKMSFEICRKKWIYHFLLQLNVFVSFFFFLKMAGRFSIRISHQITDVVS